MVPEIVCSGTGDPKRLAETAKKTNPARINRLLWDGIMRSEFADLYER
jgi:hypothetical protein